jgi:hypothetical protein
MEKRRLPVVSHVLRAELWPSAPEATDNLYPFVATSDQPIPSLLLAFPSVVTMQYAKSSPHHERSAT